MSNSSCSNTNLLINFRKAQRWEKCLWFVLMKQLFGRSGWSCKLTNERSWRYQHMSNIPSGLIWSSILHVSSTKRLLCAHWLYRHLQAVRMHYSWSPPALVTSAWGHVPPGQRSTFGSHGDDAMKTPQMTNRQCAFILSIPDRGTMGHSGE